jgi:hypothetical protein
VLGVRDHFWPPNVTCLVSLTPRLTPNVMCTGFVSLYITSFLHQCTLFGFFWLHFVMSGFPWQGINDGHQDLTIHLFYSWCSLAATLHLPHKITVPMRHELGWLLTLAHCLLRLHFLVDTWPFAADLIWLLGSGLLPWFIWSDSSVLVCLLGSSDLTPRFWSASLVHLICLLGSSNLTLGSGFQTACYSILTQEL